MTISAKILADSVNPSGVRLVTWELTYPRFIHSEFMTHRVFSRNAASSRAIPVEKLIQAVESDPAMPVFWGKNQKGMQAAEELDESAKLAAKARWLAARDDAVRHVKSLIEVDLHKQIANRVLEPWMHITVIASATDHKNFFRLRAHPAAQPEFQALAREMQTLFEAQQPQVRDQRDWHLPLVTDEERAEFGDDAIKMSVARCARVSYVRQHDEKTLKEDVDLHDRLASSGHWSPFEHQARASATNARLSNFRGWHQYRKTFQGEGEE